MADFDREVHQRIVAGRRAKCCKARPPVEARRRQTRAPSVGLLGINLTAVRRRLVEKDEYEGVAGLRD